MPKTINAHEHPVAKIFSDEYVFYIPGYQRPYAWTTEQAQELFDDINQFRIDVGGAIEEMPPLPDELLPEVIVARFAGRRPLEPDTYEALIISANLAGVISVSNIILRKDEAPLRLRVGNVGKEVIGGLGGWDGRGIWDLGEDVFIRRIGDGGRRRCRAWLPNKGALPLCVAAPGTSESNE